MEPISKRIKELEEENGRLKEKNGKLWVENKELNSEKDMWYNNWVSLKYDYLKLLDEFRQEKNRFGKTLKEIALCFEKEGGEN